MGPIAEIIAKIQTGDAKNFNAIYFRYRTDRHPGKNPLPEITADEHKDFLREVLPSFYQKINDYFLQMADAVRRNNAAEFTLRSNACYSFYALASATFFKHPTTSNNLSADYIPDVWDALPLLNDENDLQAVFIKMFPNDAQNPILTTRTASITSAPALALLSNFAVKPITFQVNTENNTALHYACKANDLTAVNALLQKELDCDAVNLSGQTADLLTTDKQIKEAIRLKRTSFEDRKYVHITCGIKNPSKLDGYLDSLNTLIKGTTDFHCQYIAALTNQFIEDIKSHASNHPNYLKNRVESYLNSVEPHLDKLPCSAFKRMLVGAIVGLVVCAIIFAATGGLGTALAAVTALSMNTGILTGSALVAGGINTWTWRPASYTNAIAKNAKEMAEPTQSTILSRPFY